MEIKQGAIGMKMKKIRNQINFKIFFERAKDYAIKFIYNMDSEYEPLRKCNNAFWGSIVVGVISLIISIISLIRKSHFTELMLSIFLICILIALITLYSGCDMIRKLENGEINSDVINVIKKGYFEKSGSIEAVTEDGENSLFFVESNQKIKNKRKYKIYWFERNGDKVITYARQVSKEKGK